MWLVLVAQNDQDMGMGQPSLLKLGYPGVCNSLAKDPMLEQIIKERLQFELEDTHMEVCTVCL